MHMHDFKNFMHMHDFKNWHGQRTIFILYVLLVTEFHLFKLKNKIVILSNNSISYVYFMIKKKCAVFNVFMCIYGLQASMIIIIKCIILKIDTVKEPFLLLVFSFY